jgi:hypothetical protein
MATIRSLSHHKGYSYISCYQPQSRPTLSDKILKEKEKFKLGFSENPDFLRLKTRDSALIQTLLPSTLHLVTASLVLGQQENSLTDDQ